jgi:hypothetical protein
MNGDVGESGMRDLHRHGDEGAHSARVIVTGKPIVCGTEVARDIEVGA